jgi:hypothetical protein
MFCKWIEKYIDQVKKKSGNSTTFISNETRTSANRNVGFKNSDSTPASNITIEGKANQIFSAGAISEQEFLKNIAYLQKPGR